MSSPSALIERMGFGYAQWKVLLGGGGSKLADGSELLLLGSVTRAVAGEWNLDMWQRGIVVSVVFLGVLVGNLMSGVIGDKMGRRLPIIVSYIGICLFSLLSVLASGFLSITCIRFCVGVSFGISGPAFNTLCGEMTPSDNRLKMNALGQLFFAGGEFYSAWLVWMQDPYMMDLNWRYLICLGTVPSFVFLIVAILVLNESPSFLMVNGRRDEAQRVLQDLRNSNGALDVDIDLADPALSTSSEQRPSVSIRDKLGIVLGRHLLYTTMVVCVSVFTLNFVFYGGLYAFPRVLPDLKLHVSPAINLMIGASVEMIGFVGGSIVCNYLSRKTSMLMYLLVVLTSTLTFSFAGLRIMNTSLERHLEFMVQCGLLGNKIFTAVGFLVVYVYAAEIYPTVARTTGGALCIAFGRLGSIVAPTAFENLAFLTENHAAYFNLTAGLCAVNAMLVLFLPYETQGLVLQDHFDEQQPIRSKLHHSNNPCSNFKLP